MAAWLPKCAIVVPKGNNVYLASIAVPARDYSSQPRVIKSPTTASLKRGTGGRSSFNGKICTVFGCTGFLGRYVCNRLGKMGTQMILPYRSDHYECMPLKLTGDLGQVLFHPFHLRDEKSIVKCMKYSNVVVNLIGRDFETKNFDYDDVHVTGARTIARLAKECGVEKLIHVSRLNADPDPPPVMLPKGSAILRAKGLGEIAVREEFPDATIIRPADIYGQEDSFMNSYMHFWRRHFRRVPLWEKGEKTEKQPVHVSDVAAGIAAAVTDPHSIGKTYQFVGPRRYKLSEIINWWYRLINDDLSIRRFEILDLKYAPLFQVKVTLTEFLMVHWPFGNLHWEALEREYVTDTVKKDLPTLEDLGVSPITMESRMKWEIAPYRLQRQYMMGLGDLVEIDPPKTVPIS